MLGLKQSVARPRVACEITTDRVIAARASEQGSAVDTFTTRRLPEDAVAPNLSGPNVQDGAALRNAIKGALTAVSGKSRDVVAILPDAAIRVLLLDFEDLPAKAQESDAVVRFRLKKSLPFDVEEAALSCVVRRNHGSVQVVAAVSPKDVIMEYEAAFREAGYLPGVILPSSVAALGLVEGRQPSLMLKVDQANITVAAAIHQELRLIRTLDNPRGASVTPSELAETVLPSIVFFEDTFGAPIELIFVNGVTSMDEVGPMLHEQTGARVEELAPRMPAAANLSGDSIQPFMISGVAGALLG